MERNPTLKVFAVLRRLGGKPASDEQLRSATGLTQSAIDFAAEELEEEGLVLVTRTYVLTEQ